MNRNRPLTYEELVSVAENMSDIEDLTDDDEDDVPEEFEEGGVRGTCHLSSGFFCSNIYYCVIAESEAQDEDDLEQEGNESHVSEPDDISKTIITEPQPGPSHVRPAASNKQAVKDYMREHDLTPKDRIGWRNVLQYITPNFLWHQEKISPDDELETPVNFFGKYFTPDVFEDMATYTNIYAVNQHSRFIPTTTEEMKVFVGIHIAMGNMRYPRVRCYWDTKLRIPLIADNMSLNRFFRLRQHVHFVDTEHRDPATANDRFWKVRPLYQKIRNRCLSLPLEGELCIDEQMIPFKGNLNVKQYVKNKPTPWGIKLYAFCGRSGLLYDFIIYQGATTELDSVEKDVYGLAGAVVIKLCQRISENNVQVYFDNFFSNYNVLQYLRNKFVYATCTARVDRFKKPPFSADKDMKKQGRGSMEEVVSADGDVIMTKWYDNKPLVMASNFMGMGEPDRCRRWDKTTKEYIFVSRPEVVKRYNKCMGGVDKLDFLITIYRTFIKSKKWTLRMFTHAIDVACVNAWLEYKEQAEHLGRQKKDILDLLHFRVHIAEALILSGNAIAKRRGRPASETPSPRSSPTTSSRRREFDEVRPISDIRYDNIGHWPIHDDKSFASRCKNTNCKGFSRIMCNKCKVHLCLSKTKNCFLNFHSK